MRSQIFFIILGALVLSGCVVKFKSQDINQLSYNTTTEGNSDFEKHSFTWFWVEPFWDFTLKSGQFSFNDPEGSKSYLVRGTETEGSYIFSGENISWELILEECQDASKGDLHQYTISLILDGENTYEGCADPEK